ncbi:MAG: 16S rRNA (guanine(527)-N(7))-methyltransferase RsmG [Sporichthyaceae bacterium]
MDVSRETAGAVFGPELERAAEFARLLVTDGVVRGLIGPREADRIWERHLLNSAVVVQACPPAGLVIDVGSGAGLPGIPMALARPDLTVRLVEPLLRRVTFLGEVVQRLGLTNVDVVRGRAEEMHGRWTASTVTARAVAPLEKLARWCLPLVAPGGSLLALKGERAEAELTAATPSLAALGVVSASVEEVGVGVIDPPVRLVRLTRAAGRD